MLKTRYKTKRTSIDTTGLDEDQIFWMLTGEETLKKLWDNPYDEIWDDVL